nr:lytic transglycosylase domain-containing protein [Micromonospora krabiensis]
MVDGEDRSTHRPLRPAAPLDGALAESGAAPDPAPRPVPRPRRPWLRSETPETPNSAGPAASASGLTGEADRAATADRTDAAEPSGAATEARPTSTTDTGAAGVTDAARATDVPADATTGASATTGDTATRTADAGTTAAGGATADTTTTGDATAAGSGRAGATGTTGTTPTGTSGATPASTSGATPAGASGATPASTSDKSPASTTDATPTDAGAATSASTGGAAAGAATVDGAAAAVSGRRRRVPFAHAPRLRPRQAAATAARATRAWSRRPSGRLTLPGAFLLILVFAMAAAGAVVVPAAVRAPRTVAADEGATAGLPPEIRPSEVPTGPSGNPSGLPGGGLPTYPYPSGSVPPGGPVVGAVGGRPADALAGWAQQVGAKVGIAPVAMQAYGYAELVLAQTNRSCALSWTTLAAIGSVESNHGRHGGAQLGQDGRATPEIIGLPLDGRDGRMRIIDTDRGALDKDTTYDRAIGPMQFIPTTWAQVGVDADNDGRKDPHDLDDAALAAGNYLCRNGRNLSIAEDWWNAILSYNDVRRYAQDVFDAANRYGQASRT